MIDSLVRCLNKIKKEQQQVRHSYLVATFHRPENVDNKDVLKKIIDQLSKLTEKYDIYVPLHPRTKAKIEEFGYEKTLERFKILPPLGYVDFLKLVKDSLAVITDSGGVQEETSYLGIPCYTVRKNTERPITVRLGTNKLIDYQDIERELVNITRREQKEIPMWDGKTAQRVVKVLNRQICFI